MFGRWRLICSAPAATPPTPAALSASNECRINHEVADPARPGRIIAALNFGASGTPRRLVALIRLPPTAQPGDMVILRADDATRARIPVTACSANECAADGHIDEEDWERLVDARSLQIAFPARNRQRVLVDISLNGLRDAAHAMSVAQK
jgi:invasion protein IalB